MSKTYVYFWDKVPGQQPVAGGFLRCDSEIELADFLAQCESLGLAVKVA